MTICSMVLHARPEKAELVCEQLGKQAGVEVHANTEDGRLIITIDHPDRTYCSETMMQMHNLDGVLSAALVYEYHEDHDLSDAETRQ